MIKTILIMTLFLFYQVSFLDAAEKDSKIKIIPYYLLIQNAGAANGGSWMNASVSIFPSEHSCLKAMATVNDVCKAWPVAGVTQGVYHNHCSAICKIVE